MARNKFFYYLKLLFTTKYVVRPPKPSEVLIYDHGAEQLSFLELNKWPIFCNRGEEINLYILIKSIFSKGILNITENYRNTLIEHINPKFIITYKCDNKYFYEFKKKFKNIKTILIQWGKTSEAYLRHFKSQNNDFNVDEMYLYGEETAKIFSKFIRGKTFSIGSIANNRHEYSGIKKDSLIFISQSKSGRPLFTVEKLILKFLKNWCAKNNLHLGISTRLGFDDRNGKKEYTNILGEAGWDYYPRIIKGAAGDYEQYKKVMTSEYVVAVESTLGYEALARNKKTVFFPLGSYSKEWCKDNYIYDLKNKLYWIPQKFGFPFKFEPEGKFWLSHYNLDKMAEKMNFVLNVDDQKWLETLKEIKIDKIIKFDLHNKTLISNLNKLGLPLKADYLIKQKNT